MKLIVNLIGKEVAMPDFPWPQGAPVPAVGDSVLVRHDGEHLGFRVTSRFLAPGTGHDGHPATVVQLGIEVQDLGPDE